MGIWAVSKLGLLWTVLLWAFVHLFLEEHIYTFLLVCFWKWTCCIIKLMILVSFKEPLKECKWPDCECFSVQYADTDVQWRINIYLCGAEVTGRFYPWLDFTTWCEFCDVYKFYFICWDTLYIVYIFKVTSISPPQTIIFSLIQKYLIIIYTSQSKILQNN